MRYVTQAGKGRQASDSAVSFGSSGSWSGRRRRRPPGGSGGGSGGDVRVAGSAREHQRASEGAEARERLEVGHRVVELERAQARRVEVARAPRRRARGCARASGPRGRGRRRAPRARPGPGTRHLLSPDLQARAELRRQRLLHPPPLRHRDALQEPPRPPPRTASRSTGAGRAPPSTAARAPGRGRRLGEPAGASTSSDSTRAAWGLDPSRRKGRRRSPRRLDRPCPHGPERDRALPRRRSRRQTNGAGSENGPCAATATSCFSSRRTGR